jgi:hypothetical protein
MIDLYTPQHPIFQFSLVALKIEKSRGTQYTHATKMKIFKVVSYNAGKGFSTALLRRVAQHAHNMLTDRFVHCQDKPPNNPPDVGFNTIITKNVEYSMTFGKVRVICVGQKLESSAIKRLTADLNSAFKKLDRSKHTQQEIFGSRGWCSAESVQSIECPFDVEYYPYLTNDVTGGKTSHRSAGCNLATIILDISNTYTLPDGFEHPEFPYIADLACAKQICPIPLLYNVYTGFLQEIFYYLVCHDETPPNIINRLKKLTPSDDNRACSSYCRRKCQCKRTTNIHVGHRPIFPNETRMPSVIHNHVAVYKRSDQTADQQQHHQILDITNQTVAKGTSVAANKFYEMRGDIQFKEWGTFLALKIQPQDNWESVIQEATVDDQQKLNEQSFNRCAISGQPLYDDCYYVTIGTEEKRVGILISLFVAYHTEFLQVARKKFRTVNVYHTCVPQTFADILATYMAEENSKYTKVLHAAYYGTVKVDAEHLRVEHAGQQYNIRTSGYIESTDHAVLCL